MKTIREILIAKNYKVASDDTITVIDLWGDWYKSQVEGFHSYNYYNGITTTEVERYSLGMAKTVAEDWANLLLNEKVEIRAGKDLDKVVKETLDYNNFMVKGNQLIELSFALGTGAFVEYLDKDKKVVIDFVRAQMIYPIKWDNGYISECAFASMRVREEVKQYYIQIHRSENGKYIIENLLVDADSGADIDLDEDMEEFITTGSEKPLFQIITPNIVNTVDLDSPYGISVYGNAIPQLKGCDVIYDSYINEFELGRKRIVVPVSMAKQEMMGDGTVKPIFNTGDRVFWAVQGDTDGKETIHDIDMSLRASEHQTGLNDALNILSVKCGFGKGHYKFDNGVVKTATEVISADSELYKTLKKHESMMKSALTGMVESIAFLNGKKYPVDVEIDFDDSIIQDKDAERKQDMADIAIGAMSIAEYRSKYYNETIEEATANIPQTADVIQDVAI